MGRSIEVSGESILLLFYAVSLPSLLFVFAVVLWPLDDPTSVGLAILIALLIVAVGIGEWRRRTGREDEHLGTEDDLAYSNLYAYLGGATKRGQKETTRRSSGDDES